MTISFSSKALGTLGPLDFVHPCYMVVTPLHVSRKMSRDGGRLSYAHAVTATHHNSTEILGVMEFLVEHTLMFRQDAFNMVLK